MSRFTVLQRREPWGPSGSWTRLRVLIRDGNDPRSEEELFWQEVVPSGGSPGLMTNAESQQREQTERAWRYAEHLCAAERERR